MSVEDELSAAVELADGVRSFLDSLPYMAPEILAEPLAEYDEARS